MKKLTFILFLIILANVYLWRNPITEESYARPEEYTNYVIEFSFTNNCAYYSTMDNITFDNCKYSYNKNKVTITYTNKGEKVTETYKLSEDRKTLTLEENEDLIYTRFRKNKIFNENH